MPKTLRRIVTLVVLLVALGAAWQLGLKRMLIFQSWEGRVRDLYRIRDVKKDTYKPHGQESPYWYDYFWRVVRDDGSEFDVQLPMKVWGAAGPGQRVVKSFGSRWPALEPLTDEDRAYAVEHGYMQPPEVPSYMKEGAELDEEQAFLAENAKKEGVEVLPSGLQYRVIKEGSGPKPKASDSVQVNYRGTFIDGTEFDSGVTKFGVGKVIPGWTEALQLMEVGTKWELFIPSELAYGEKGRGKIGPNKTLVFEVELLGITP